MDHYKYSVREKQITYLLKTFTDTPISLVNLLLSTTTSLARYLLSFSYEPVPKETFYEYAEA